MLDAQATREEEPQLADGAIGGLLIESHGFVGAGELTRALAAAAAPCTSSSAAACAPSRAATAWIVDTNRGSLTGNAVGALRGPSLATSPSKGSARGPCPSRARAAAAPGLARHAGAAAAMRWRTERCSVGATWSCRLRRRTTVAGVQGLLDAVGAVVPRAWTAAFWRARGDCVRQPPTICRSSDSPRWYKPDVQRPGTCRNGVLLAPRRRSWSPMRCSTGSIRCSRW